MKSGAAQNPKAIKKAILNDGMELDKTANKGQQKKAEATGRHVREDNRTDRDEIPTFFLPNQGIPKDTEDTFWVESYPILKIVSHNHNDERDFT